MTTRTYASPADTSNAFAKLVRDNVLRVSVVLFGMTLFIAVAEARTPINEVNLTNLPEIISQVANQTTTAQNERADTPILPPLHRADQDYSIQVAPSNLFNSPAARYFASQLK